MSTDKKNNAQYINQSSGKVDYYTPLEIVEAAREVMGSINLDPASDAHGNTRINADRYFDESMDGLSMTWAGTVWMNHPFTRVGNPKWVTKLLSEYQAGNVSQACAITYASSSEQWYQPLLDYPICFLSPRTNYYLADGTLKGDVTKGSSVVYLGPWVNAFLRVFKGFGRVLVPPRFIKVYDWNRIERYDYVD